MKYEDLLKMSPGDQVLVEDPMFGKMQYALVFNEEGRLDFLNFQGSSLLINCQETVDAFKVEPLDESQWDREKTEAAKEMNEQLSNLKEMFGE